MNRKLISITYFPSCHGETGVSGKSDSPGCQYLESIHQWVGGESHRLGLPLESDSCSWRECSPAGDQGGAKGGGQGDLGGGEGDQGASSVGGRTSTYRWASLRVGSSLLCWSTGLQECSVTLESLRAPRARWAEQQGVGLSPQGPYLSCEPTLFEKSADKLRLVELEDSTMLDGTTGGLPLLNTRPRGFPGTPWIFSPDFELGKTGQRGVMKKNRLFCYEIPKYSWSFVWKAEERWIPMLCFFC